MSAHAVPQMLVSFCAQFEGFHKRTVLDGVELAVPYICPAGYWTIGYGHLCTKDTQPITRAQAEEILCQDLAASVAASLRICPILAEESEHRLAAVASFVFNLGAGRLQSSTLRRRINQGAWQEAGDEFLRWVNGGGRKLAGLVIRRAAERRLFLEGVYNE